MKIKLSKDTIKYILMMLITLTSSLVFFLFKNFILSYALFIPAVIIALFLVIKKPLFTIDILLFLTLDGIGLMPSLEFGGGTFSFSDLSIVFILYLFLMTIKYKKKSKLDIIGIIIILFFIFRIIGAISGLIIYNQPIPTGLLTLRDTYIYLAYFPIKKMICNNVFTNKDLLKEIINFTKIVSILYFIEVILLYFNVGITNFSYDYRWGYRLRASNYLQIIGVFFVFYKLMKKENEKGDIVWLIIFFMEAIFINQSRFLIFGLLLTLIISFLAFPTSKRKIGYALIILIIGSALALNSKVQNILMETIYESQSTSSGNILYRTYEKDYYDKLLVDHKIIGVGTPSMHGDGPVSYYSGNDIKGEYNGYYMSGFYLSDLGIYAFKYYWGYIGYILYILIMVTAFFKAFYYYYILKNLKVDLFIVCCSLLLNIVVSYSLCYFIFQPYIFLIIFVLWCGFKHREVKKEEYDD